MSLNESIAENATLRDMLLLKLLSGELRVLAAAELFEVNA